MNNHIEVDTSKQILYLFESSEVSQEYQVSTAKNGVGQESGSGGTPLGMHEIAEKYGENAEINSVFVGRKETGEIYTPELAVANPKRDWSLTRILRLGGLEPGYNQGKSNEGNSVDSFNRYIYIHGTPDTEPMGEPLSHGCIRMRNNDVEELFGKVDIGTKVKIV